MSLRVLFAAAAVALATFSAQAQTFVFDLRGSQEVPTSGSTASGGCFGQLNQGSATFSITCVHDVVNATVMHIHHGAAGTSGAVAFDLGNPASGLVSATWSGMTATDISDLLAGNLYVNIHTAGRPNGEIRGQIVSRSVDTVSFTADGAHVVPPNSSSSTASCSADLNDAATSLAVQCTHTMSGANAAHVHNAPVGTTGPVVFTFPSAASPLSANMSMTPELVADFAATFLYLDIHQTPAQEGGPADEIRGQIGTPPAGAGTGTIVIEKQTYPAGGSGFGFTENITPGTFTLADAGTKTFASVAPGTYTVTENDPSASNFTLADVSCVDNDSTADVSTRTATIHLAAGETVRCKFRNLLTAATDSLFVFHLSGDQEVPAVTTTETGGCMARFDSGASRLSLVCTHDVANPTSMHIHRGAAGSTGPVIFDLRNPTSPVIATWSGMAPADVADLLAGNLYVNIHTAGRPTGDNRGQILPRTVDTVSFTADASQVVPPGTSSSTGSCTADLSNDATALAISCTHNVAGATAARVHQAPRGANGPLVFTFGSPASPLSANMPMTPRLVADYAARLLYLEVHGSDASEAAANTIRGQIAPPLATPTTGTIRIRKATSPAGGSGFPFTETITPGSFTLADGGERVFDHVTPGTYTVTEGTIAGWSLTDLTCSDSDSTADVVAGSATVRLQAGETVTCTFTNLQRVAASSTFVFHLSGDQEVPPNASTARGGCFGQLDSASRRLALVCTHNVVGATTMHIHSSTDGAIRFDLGNPVSPVEATWNLTQPQMDELLAGSLYVNIHTSGRPAGEIRGRILARTVDQVGLTLTSGQVVPPTDSPATGSCNADLSNDAASVFVQCTQNVAGFTDIHLHDGPSGVNGPIVRSLPAATFTSATASLTPRLVADFAAGFLYVDVHSAAYPAGAVRGQFFGAAVAAIGVPALEPWVLGALILLIAAIAWRRMS